MLKRRISGITFALLLVMAFYFAAVVKAQFTEMSVINPETQDSNFTFDSYTATVGSRFNATVWVSNVTSLFAYQAKLRVNGSLLNITDAWVPTWNSSWVFYGQATVRPPTAYYDDDMDNSSEAVLVGDSLLIGDPFNGSGLLAVIQFEIMYTPVEGTIFCDLDMNNTDTSLLNYDLEDITTAKNGGYYEYESVEDETPPVIHEVYQIPHNESVTPSDEVDVYANVTDDLSGVKQVILNYTADDETWFTEEMTLSDGLYNATIPAFPYCTNVTYVIMAEDNADNAVTTEEMGYTYKYHVIPEFPLIAALLLTLILTTIAVIIGRKSLSKRVSLNQFHLH